MRLLRDGPKTMRELFFDMGGTMDKEAIRWRLNKAREAGLAELNGTTWKLTALPQIAGALPDPVVEQPAA